MSTSRLTTSSVSSRGRPRAASSSSAHVVHTVPLHSVVRQLHQSGWNCRCRWVRVVDPNLKPPWIVITISGSQQAYCIYCYHCCSMDISISAVTTHTKWCEANMWLLSQHASQPRPAPTGNAAKLLHNPAPGTLHSKRHCSAPQRPPLSVPPLHTCYLFRSPPTHGPGLTAAPLNLIDGPIIQVAQAG